MEDSFYWPLPFITEPNREYVIAAVNFYYQRQDLDWLIFVCCRGLESFANTRLGSCDDLLQSILLSETGVFPTDNRLFLLIFQPLQAKKKKMRLICDFSPAALQRVDETDF